MQIASKSDLSGDAGGLVEGVRGTQWVVDSSRFTVRHHNYPEKCINVTVWRGAEKGKGGYVLESQPKSVFGYQRRPSEGMWEKTYRKRAGVDEQDPQNRWFSELDHKKAVRWSPLLGAERRESVEGSSLPQGTGFRKIGR